MADKQINQLTAATSVNDADLFVMQQNSVAKKLSGEKFKEFIRNTTDIVNLANEVRSIAAEFDTEPGYNLYDEAHNSVVASDPQYLIGTVYLDGYSGDMVVSCKGARGNYITNPVIYYSDGTSEAGTFGTATYSIGSLRHGRPITIPSGAEKFEFKYRIASGSGTLVEEVMVTAGTTVPAYYEPYKAYTVLVNSDYADTERVEEIMNSYVYVMLNGSDANDGLTPATAFASIGKALSVSSKVLVQRGTYNESIQVIGQNNISILPYDNDKNFDQNEPYREKITVTSASFTRCHNLRIEDMRSNHAVAAGFAFDQCMNVYILNCESYDAGVNGFFCNNTNIVLDRCLAENCGYRSTTNGGDGFNFHTYGQSVLIDCIANDIHDDGCSHHNGCCGTVIGGMFMGCGKGGMTPAQGAVVNCYGIYSANNRFGHYVVSDQGTSERTFTNLICSAFVDNTDTGIQCAAGHVINAINCSFSGNGTDVVGSGVHRFDVSVPGKIDAPSSASNGQFLMYDGSAWVAQSLPLYNGGVSSNA